MVSPMREKRVWPPARKEADAAETVAQFEATVAVAKQTVAKSGEVLSSAKEDLSDHQRWLQLQTAAVEKDRVRHERWLQRQRERKEAAERREEARERRHAFYGRIGAAITRAVMRVVNAVTGATGFVFGRIARGFASVFRAIGRGFAAVGAQIRRFAVLIFAQLRFGALWLAVKLQELFGAAGVKVVATTAAVAAVLTAFARSAGEKATSTAAGISAKAGELARSTGEAVSSGVSQVSAKAQEIAAQRAAPPVEMAAFAEDDAEPAEERLAAPDIEAIEGPAEDETVAASFEDSGVPAHFRSAAESMASPTVYQFASVQRQSFFHRDEAAQVAEPAETLSALSEPGGNVAPEPLDIEEDDAPETADPYAEFDAPDLADPYAEFAARDARAAAQGSGGDRETVFGGEPAPGSGAALGSELADRARAFGHDAGAGLAAAFAGVAAVAARFGRSVAAWTTAIFAVASAKLRDMAPAGERVSQSVSGAGAKARDLGSTAASSIKPAFSGLSAKMQTAMPAFHGLLAGAGERAKLYAGAGAAVAATGAAQVKSLRDAGRNALSLPEGVDRDKGEISRMLIIAGILMLICGALLIGSGLILRAGAPSMPAFSTPFSSEPEPAEAVDEVDVVWLFDDPERTAEERSVFVTADGPGIPRLVGLAFNAENWSDHTLTDFHGTVKPDLKIIDFKLAIDLIETVGPAPASPAPDTVPPRTAFRLVVPFPREVEDGAEGVEVDDFLGGYGGLTLKVRYAVDGREKSYIQYLSPAVLKAQLAEVAGNADAIPRF